MSQTWTLVETVPPIGWPPLLRAFSQQLCRTFAAVTAGAELDDSCGVRSRACRVAEDGQNQRMQVTK